MTSHWRSYRAAPQPARAGRDLCPTPRCLARVLITDVLPRLPASPILEPAAGDGRLAEAMRRDGRVVVASDIETDFRTATLPGSFAGIVTNPPFHQFDTCIDRSLALLVTGVTQSVVLLLRFDHLAAKGRMGALECAAEITVCPWRARWIPNSTGQPRWAFTWVVWRADRPGPPVALHVRQAVTA